MPPRLATKTGSQSAKPEGRARRTAKAPRNRALKKKPEPKPKPKAKGSHKASRHRPGRGGPRRSGQRRGRAAPSAVPSVPDHGDAALANVCPICQETYCPVKFPVVHAPCGHVACASCSLTWQRKKSTRTCALCRTPVLSVAHCTQLEQLLVRRQEPEQSASGASASSSSGMDVETTRAEVKKGLQELSQGDLNFIPGDYRAHLVRLASHRAVRKGDMTMLETCLRDFKARASTRLVCDVAGLWKKEPRPVLSLLLAHGARIDGHTEDRPLLHAVYCGNTRMVEALLEMKADPKKKSAGESPLQVAVRRGRQEAVRMLLAHGVQTDEPDPAGRTPQFLAELAWRMHVVSCPGGQCQRCAERGGVRTLLAAVSDGREPAAAVPPRPEAREQEEQDQEAESEDSSSDWEESGSDVSDMDDWASEDEDEEEEEDGEEEDQDEDDDDDDDEEEDGGNWRVMQFR